YQAIVLLLLWLAGFYMRLPILAAPPLVPAIHADFDLIQSVIGALTTLPVLMMGLGALPASLLIGRIGARKTLVWALLTVGVFSALRGAAPNIVLLLACTAVMGLGIAAMQPALPALVPRWCPHFVALGMAIYVNGMFVSEVAGAGLTLPVVLPLAGGEWRLALVLWSLPAMLVAFALLYPRLHGAARPRAATGSIPDPRDGQLWLFGLILGATSGTFFGVNAYMASMLQEKAAGDWLNLALLLLNLSQLLTSFLMLAAARHIFALPRLLFITISVVAVSLIGFIVLPGALAITAVVLIGFCCALQMNTLVMLPPLLRNPVEAGKLAAGMFALGYGLAFLVPLGAGTIADLSGSAHAALWLFVAFNVVCMPLAWHTHVAQPRQQQ